MDLEDVVADPTEIPVEGSTEAVVDIVEVEMELGVEVEVGVATAVKVGLAVSVAVLEEELALAEAAVRLTTHVAEEVMEGVVVAMAGQVDLPAPLGMRSSPVVV